VIGPEEIEGYRRDFLDQFPEADGHFLDWGVSCEVVVNILGVDWYREHLTSSRMHPYFLSQAVDASHAAYMRDHRVITFGRNLFELQSAPFFDDMVPELRRRAVLGVATGGIT
jgi:hypothetical protein